MNAAFYIGAELSNDRLYRYRLWRRWSVGFPTAYWIMLNPSTADERKDDATIRRCINFSRQWGYGGLEVLNLFAARATNPRGLSEFQDPIGPENNRYLSAIPSNAEIIAAWGKFPRYLGNRDKDVLLLLGSRTVHCLGVTLDGYPRHPVRLANSTERSFYFKPEAPGRSWSEEE